MIPGLKYVYIIHDKSESGISAGNIIKNAVQNNSDLLISDLSDYPQEQILSIVHTLNDDSIVFLASYYSDINQVSVSIQEFTDRISEKSSVPVFAIDETVLGAGSIGGSLTSGTVHGKMAAEVGLRTLKGENADQIAVVDRKSVFWGFDYEVLQRYGFSLSNLPEDSKVINKPFSFFETYRTLVLSTVLIIVALFLFIMIQSLHLKYRMQIERTLKKQKEEIYQLAYYSPVTGLRNRVSLKEQMESTIQCDTDGSDFFALIYIDLDNFKEVNDIFGHLVGDKLLRSIAQRMKEIEAVDDNAYSLGGDEFVVLIRGYDKGRVEEMIKKLFHSLSEPIVIDHNTFYITVSGGIVYYPDHGENYIELLKNADTAMYRSKELGKGIFTCFDQSMSDDAVEKTMMQRNLRMAMKNGDFLLYYQPQINAKNREIWGYEALLRWNHPELGLIQPLSFIKIAEDSRLIISIGEWVLETACTFVKNVQDEFQKNYIVSVNISVIQLIQDDFVESVLKILERAGLSPNFLELEITESVFLKSSNYIIEKLEKLKEAGIRVALDDFGTGYSSLSYLSELPISTLKIDKTFIHNYFESDKNMILTSTIIKMGHALGLELVAEGVETEAQLELFTRIGCDRIQGYLVSKPVTDWEVFQSLQ